MVYLVQGEQYGCVRKSRDLPLIAPNSGEACHLQASLVHSGCLQVPAPAVLSQLVSVIDKVSWPLGYDPQEQKAAWGIDPHAGRSLWCPPAD